MEEERCKERKAGQETHVSQLLQDFCDEAFYEKDDPSRLTKAAFQTDLSQLMLCFNCYQPADMATQVGFNDWMTGDPKVFSNGVVASVFDANARPY